MALATAALATPTARAAVARVGSSNATQSLGVRGESPRRAALAGANGLEEHRYRRERRVAWILPVLAADVTGGELDECTRIIDAM